MIKDIFNSIYSGFGAVRGMEFLAMHNTDTITYFRELWK